MPNSSPGGTVKESSGLYNDNFALGPINLIESSFPRIQIKNSVTLRAL